ncbi:MAG: hypothetical protein ATN36_07830 [Epulopiscium sp. Nele67-Bin005]|nr:MAG: hypothetical protein ATN36_07830 [Epulopiscium sp. Nele67-Bin005]
MQLIGFVLFVIGLGICFLAKRIIMRKMDIDQQDRKEFEMLVSGAILAVRLAGLVTSALGFIFLLIS